MKHYLSLVFVLTASLASTAQVVNIPDPVLKAYLVANTSVNTNSDSEIQVSEAQAYLGTLNISNMGIADITGIEEFINISKITAQNCNITSADFSSNTYLNWISIGSNPLTSLNISSNINLQTLVVDKLPLATIDISSNVNLKTFYAYLGDLEYMDFSNNVLLEDVKVWSSLMDSIDLSHCPNLTIVSVNDCQLHYLNIKNGANTNLNHFKTEDNPDLYCVEVDDTVYSNANWGTGSFGKDSQTFYSEDCELAMTREEFSNFTPEIYPNPTNGEFSINVNPIGITIYDLQGKQVQSFASIKTVYDVSFLKAGVYVVSIETSGGVHQKKLVVE